MSAPGGHYKFYSPEPRLIVYRRYPGAYPPVLPVPVPKAKTVPEKDPWWRNTFLWEWQPQPEQVTGWGTAMIMLYYIVSQGAQRAIMIPAGILPELKELPYGGKA